MEYKVLKVNLRPITDSDLDFLHKVYASTRAEEMAAQDWSQEKKDQFIQQQFNAQHKYYQENYLGSSFDIIQMNGIDVGRLYVGRWAQEIRVIDITVLPEFKNRGIGGSLMRALLEEAKAKKIPVRLHVEHYNPMLPWYQKLGFRVIGDTGVYFFLERPPN